MPTSIEAAEVHGGGSGGFTPVEGYPVDEADRFRPTDDGLGFFKFIACRLLGEIEEPSPAMSEHFDHASSRRDPAPKFEGRGHLG